MIGLGGYVTMPVWKQALFVAGYLAAIGLGGLLIAWIVGKFSRDGKA